MILKDNCSSHPVFQLNTADEQSRLTLQVASKTGLGNGPARDGAAGLKSDSGPTV